MLTMPIALDCHYKNFCQFSIFRPVRFRLSLFSQSDAFFRYQAQQTFRFLPQYSSQQLWQVLDQPLDINSKSLQYQYLLQPVKQTFIPQCQHYFTNN